MDYINTMATKRARHERHKERERRPAKRLVSAESESSDVEASRCAVGASNIVLLPSHSHAHKDSRDCEGDVHFGQGRHSLSYHSPALVSWVHAPRGCCCLEPCAVCVPLLQWSLRANPGRVQGGLGQEGALQVLLQGHGGGDLGEGGGD